MDDEDDRRKKKRVSRHSVLPAGSLDQIHILNLEATQRDSGVAEIKAS